jgi:hypothetical protein
VSAPKVPLTQSLDAWTQGYACACAVIANQNTPSDGEMLAREGGFSRDAFIKAGAEQADIDAIWPNLAQKPNESACDEEDDEDENPFEDIHFGIFDPDQGAK